MLVGNEELVVLQTVRGKPCVIGMCKQTRCVANGVVSVIFKATNKNGRGATCTAVLVKFRLPRISYSEV